ncbi:hypothetical protein DV738_g1058, partial [Chaetothyriales sp. CBS 135597]
MGRFPWSSAHSKEADKDANSDKISLDRRTKSSGKFIGKLRAEPSRNAVNQLLSYIGDGDVSPPRKPSTPSSIDSQHEDSLPPLPDESTRQDLSARNLFSKSSRMLNRKTSKRDLRFMPSFSTLDDGQSQTSRGHSTAKLSLSNRPSHSAKYVKPSISGPYGFQHLAHTGQDEFNSMNKALKPDPLTTITTVPEGEVLVDEADTVTASDCSVSKDQPVADAKSPIVPSPAKALPPPPPPTEELPSPTKALPPPPPTAEELSVGDTEVSRPQETSCTLPASRSVENFSRLTRSPVASTSEFPPASEYIPPQLSGRPESASLESLSNWAEETVGKLVSVSDARHRSTGLPQILEDSASQPPVIVHAVSTRDESAVSLSNSALRDSLPVTGHVAEPNTNSMHELDFDQELDHPGGLLRHSQSFPTTMVPRRRSQSSSDIPLISSFAEIASPSPTTIKSVRISIGLKRIEVEDWEDAIDYAWDHPLDMEEDPGFRDMDSYSAEKLPASRAESFLVVRQPSYDSTSQPATPLMMMQAPNKPLPVPNPLRRVPTLHEPNTNASLQGLGIAPTAPVLHNPAIDILPGSPRGSFGELLDRRSATGRAVPDSPMSKSSSQESIILSIASSIMGTCRSSNSSASMGDIGMLKCLDDETGDLSSRTASTAVATKSVQMPPDTLESNDSDGSQDTIISEATPAVHASAFRPVSTEDQSQTTVRTMRSASISEAFVPRRSSSITGRTSGKTTGTRSRSSTLTSRQRHTASRASYSLFPTVQPALVPPSTQTP